MGMDKGWADRARRVIGKLFGLDCSAGVSNWRTRASDAFLTSFGTSIGEWRGAAGVIFVEENGEGPGVRLRKGKGRADGASALTLR